MKGGREHRVPLSTPAIELLRGLPREDGAGFVFTGARNNGAGFSNMAMLELVRGMRSGLTTHGFRSSSVGLGDETTSTPRTVVEMSLAHAISNKTEASPIAAVTCCRSGGADDRVGAFARQPAELVSIDEKRKARRR